MKNGLFCGSFCPVTKGHMDIIIRSARLVDSLYVVIFNNVNKSYQISLNDRLDLLTTACKDLPNVTVMSYDGAVVDFCAEQNIDVIIKSARNVVDLQYELDMAQLNYDFGQAETVFLCARKEYATVSSSIVRELVAFDKDVAEMLPEGLADKTVKLLKTKKA